MQSVTSFARVIRLVVSEAKVVQFAAPGPDNLSLKGCKRPEFGIEVGCTTADLFFNSAGGYRATFLEDPEEGQKQNHLLLRALENHLLAFATGSEAAREFGIDRVRLSLRGCSAKIWLAEGGMLFGRSLIEEILVPSWVKRARTAVADPTVRVEDIWGIRAPMDTMLEVKGAYLDASDNEHVPKRKIRRRYEIHESGFS